MSSDSTKKQEEQGSTERKGIDKGAPLGQRLGLEIARFLCTAMAIIAPTAMIAGIITGSTYLLIPGLILGFAFCAVWIGLGKPQPRQDIAEPAARPHQTGDSSQPPRPRSLTEAIAKDMNAARASRPTGVRIPRPLKLIGVACVAAALAIIAIVSFRGDSQEDKWRQTKERMDRDAEDIRNEESDRQTILQAVGDFGSGKISSAEMHQIERRVKAHRANENALRQGKEDFDAGHIGIGEWHRIQREAKNREIDEGP